MRNSRMIENGLKTHNRDNYKETERLKVFLSSFSLWMSHLLCFIVLTIGCAYHILLQGDKRDDHAARVLFSFCFYIYIVSS